VNADAGVRIRNPEAPRDVIQRTAFHQQIYERLVRGMILMLNRNAAKNACIVAWAPSYIYLDAYMLLKVY
jgi:hypothetical protein